MGCTVINGTDAVNVATRNVARSLATGQRRHDTVHSGSSRRWSFLACGVAHRYGTGMAAAALTRLLGAVQHLVWSGSGTAVLEAAEHAGAWRNIFALLGAGLVTGAGQIIPRRLSSGNGIDTTAAIWFQAGRMPALRTLGSALGREGAPKQAGAVFANFFSDRAKLSDEQRRLLACGAGTGTGQQLTECPWAVRFSRWM